MHCIYISLKEVEFRVLIYVEKKKALAGSVNLLLFQLSNFKALLYSRFTSDIWSKFQEVSEEPELYQHAVPFKI